MLRQIAEIAMLGMRSLKRLLARMTPSEAFVEVLAAHQVKHVYGIAGSAFMDALDLFPQAGIRFVSTQHEQGAVWMAEAEARISGRVGVCIGQNGPGVLNFVNAVQGAFWNHTPLIAFTPDHSSTQSGLGGFQEADQLSVFRSLVKAQFQVRHPSRIADVVHQAFRSAVILRGPVQVNIPRDVWNGDFDFEIPRATISACRAPRESEISTVLSLINEARRPVMLLGGGVVQGRAVPEAIALAEKLDIPVATTYLHNDAFPSHHRLCLGAVGYNGSKAAMQAISQSDLLLCIGTRLNPYLMNPQYGTAWWPSNAKKVQVDADEQMLGLTCPVDIGVAADSKMFLNALIRTSSGISRDPSVVEDHLSATRLLNESWRSELEKLTRKSISSTNAIAPRQALQAIEKALNGRDPIICLDTGNLAAMTASYMNIFSGIHPGLLACGMWASCGPSVSYAVGAHMAQAANHDHRPVVAITGEGSFMMSGINELITAVREHTPIIVVVLVNQMWGAEAVNQRWFFGNRMLGTTFSFNPNFADLARTMGAESVRCKSSEEITAAIKLALAGLKSGKVTLVEVLCTDELGEPFRRDALKTPVRVLDKYKV